MSQAFYKVKIIRAQISTSGITNSGNIWNIAKNAKAHNNF